MDTGTMGIGMGAVGTEGAAGTGDSSKRYERCIRLDEAMSRTWIITGRGTGPWEGSPWKGGRTMGPKVDYSALFALVRSQSVM